MAAVGYGDVALVILLDAQPPGELGVALHGPVADQAAQAPAEQPAARTDADIGQRAQKALGAGQRADQVQPNRQQQQPLPQRRCIAIVLVFILHPPHR